MQSKEGFKTFSSRREGGRTSKRLLQPGASCHSKEGSGKTYVRGSVTHQGGKLQPCLTGMSRALGFAVYIFACDFKETIGQQVLCASVECPGLMLGLRTDTWVYENDSPECVLFISLSAVHFRLLSSILFCFFFFFFSPFSSFLSILLAGVRVLVLAEIQKSTRFVFVWKAFIHCISFAALVLGQQACFNSI